MRLTRFFLLFLLFVTLLISSAISAQKRVLPEAAIFEEPLYTEVMLPYPQFPGGEVGFAKFVHTKVRMPALCEHLSGKTILLQVAIDTTGYPMGLNVMRSVHPCFAPMINDIWTAMPCWIPAQKDERPVNGYFRLSIHIDPISSNHFLVGISPVVGSFSAGNCPIGSRQNGTSN